MSDQVHALTGDIGLPLFNSVLYPSRNNFPAASIAQFDPTAPKIGVIDDINLVDYSRCLG